MLPGQMIDMSCYELVVIYDKEYGEVIAFESDRFMNDSNDIVNEAINLKLFDEKYRDKVRWAQCVSEYEFEYIKRGGKQKNKSGCIHKSRQKSAVRLCPGK